MERLLELLNQDRVQLGLVVLVIILLLAAGLYLRQGESTDVSLTSEQIIVLEERGEVVNENDNINEIEQNEKLDEVENLNEGANTESEEVVEAGALAPTTKPLSEIPDRPLTQLEIQSLLSAHNAERSAVGVAPLTWSASLAASAEAWAEALQGKGCIIEHADTEYGENLYYEWTGVTGTADVSSPDRVVGWWNSEKTDYSYSANICAAGKVCSHYTQNVWEDTTEVGCAKRTCQLPGKSQEVWVCRYNPAGNVGGDRPY